MSAVTEFKVGQRWKTRAGDVLTITAIVNSVEDDTNYPVQAGGHDYTGAGYYWADATEDRRDLVELISDENGKPAGLNPVIGTSVGRTFRQDLVLALVSGLAHAGASPQHLVSEVDSLVDQLDAKYGDKEAA